MNVATYLFVMNLTTELASPSVGSNNSCKDIRAIRATASKVVSAKADTNIVMMHNPQAWGIPNWSNNPVTPVANFWNGVAVSANATLDNALFNTPECASEGNEPTTTITTIANIDSSNIEP